MNIYLKYFSFGCVKWLMPSVMQITQLNWIMLILTRLGGFFLTLRFAPNFARSIISTFWISMQNFRSQRSTVFEIWRLQGSAIRVRKCRIFMWQNYNNYMFNSKSVPNQRFQYLMFLLRNKFQQLFNYLKTWLVIINMCPQFLERSMWRYNYFCWKTWISDIQKLYFCN